MEFKVCRTCGEELEILKENFYFQVKENGKHRFTSPDCRQCINERDRVERAKEKEDDICGSDRVTTKPGTWTDDKQKAQTFQFLTLIGWKYNPEKNLWYDDIKKTSDGKFIGVWEKNKKRKRSHKRVSIPENDIPHIKIVHQHLKDKYNKHFIREIQIEYYTDFKSVPSIEAKRPGHEKIVRYVLNKTWTAIKKIRDAR